MSTYLHGRFLNHRYGSQVEIRTFLGGPQDDQLHWYSDGPASVETVLPHWTNNIWFGHDGPQDHLLSDLDSPDHWLLQTLQQLGHHSAKMSSHRSVPWWLVSGQFFFSFLKLYVLNMRKMTHKLNVLIIAVLYPKLMDRENKVYIVKKVLLDYVIVVYIEESARYFDDLRHWCIVFDYLCLIES